MKQRKTYFIALLKSKVILKKYNFLGNLKLHVVTMEMSFGFNDLVKTKRHLVVRNGRVGGGALEHLITQGITAVNFSR